MMKTEQKKESVRRLRPFDGPDGEQLKIDGTKGSIRPSGTYV